MIALLFRLLTIAAFALMPLGMSSAPAVAAGHDSMAASMPCDEHQEPSNAVPSGKMHCTACFALAAPQAVFPPVAVRLPALLLDRDGEFRLGLTPEVATPPPKRV